MRWVSSILDRRFPPGAVISEVVAVLGAVAAVTAFAAFLLRGSMLPLLGLLGLVSLAVACWRPAWFGAARLVVGCTVLPAKWGAVAVGPVNVSAMEALLGIGLAAVVLRHLTRHGAPGTPVFGRPVALYAYAAVVGGFVGISFGEATQDALTAVRAVLIITAFWLFREGFVDRPEAFGRLLVAVAVIGASLAVMGAVLGISWGDRELDYIITGGQLTETTRLDPPVLRLASLVIPMLVVGVVFARRLLWRAVLFVPLIALEVLSYTRSAWVPLLIAVILVPALVSTRPKWLVFSERSVLLVAAGVLLLPMALFGVLGQSAQLAAERLSTTVEGETLSDDSLGDRLYELENAVPAIIASPIVGVGLNNPYGAVNESYNPETNTTTKEPRRWIHNTFVGIWLWLGLLGVVATVWLAVRIWRTCRQAYGKGPSDPDTAPDMRFAVAAGAGLALIAVQSTFQTNLMYPPALLTLAAGLAYLDVWQGARARRSPSRGQAVTLAVPEQPPRSRSEIGAA